MVIDTDSLLNDVTSIVAEVKPYMFETDSTTAAVATDNPSVSMPDNPSVSSTEIDMFGSLTPGVNDEPDEEEAGKTDPELDTYIGAYVKELEAAVAEGDKEAGKCACN